MKNQKENMIELLSGKGPRCLTTAIARFSGPRGSEAMPFVASPNDAIFLVESQGFVVF